MNRMRTEQETPAPSTRHRTAENRYPLLCGQCRELYFVDESAIYRAYSALTDDSFETSLLCANCEAKFLEGYL